MLPITQCMFQNAFSFNGNVSGWNVANVGAMGMMFWKARSFDRDLNGWDVGSVTIMDVRQGSFRTAARATSHCAREAAG